MLGLLLAFAVLPLFTRALARRIGRAVFPVIALLPLAAFAHAIWLTPQALGAAPPTESLSWIPELGMALTVRMDALSWLLTLIVTGVGALVLFYCRYYFAPGEEGLGRFASVLLAFAGTMYGLVLADDIVLLFIFWEATSVFSYLLIGHYTGRRASRSAAIQALIVTTAGGLVMLVGIVMLAVTTGLTRLSELVAAAPTGPLITTAVFLILVGALSKSAIFPFHFWLPSAMAAPTPVSAYLHAAAMVQAGIYLVARLAPGFWDTPGWREILIGLGLLTMLLGGWKALGQNDLKLLLAHGTVSQLGFLIVVVGFGSRDSALAGVALLLAHALFKAALFLVVGIIDHRAGTRDVRKLSGLGREAPVLTAIATLALLSMAGLPLTFGFVAKEAVLGAFLSSADAGDPVGMLALIGVALGSVLTVAYTVRFHWGAFWRKPEVEQVSPVTESFGFLVPPAVLALAGVAGFGLAGTADHWFRAYAQTFPGAGSDLHLAPWHGFDVPLGISTLSVLFGVALFLLREPIQRLRDRSPSISASDTYWRVIRMVDKLAVRVTGATQRGSLPFYLGVILLVFVLTNAVTLALNDSWPTAWRLWDSPVQLAIGGIMALAALALATADRRFQAAIVIGVTGYGVAALFAFHGAPDLALTQVLVETVTLIAFVLVLRRLPIRLGQLHDSRHRLGRMLVGLGVAASMATIAIVTLAARATTPISAELPELAYEGGHGQNVVNVILVDVRGWDTLGELSVIIAAATGVASLVFLRSRTDDLPRVPRSRRRGLRSRMTRVAEPLYSSIREETSQTERNAWLLAGYKLAPENRSILLEVVVRLLFHAVIVLSVFILFSGHNLPGGGFAGGLVAGLALAGRYLAAGRYELGAAVPLDAGRLLGTGLILAAGTALVPVFFGQPPLTSTAWELEVPLLGHLEFVSSTIFDIGVYLVVIGMMLDVLRSLGAEVDRHQEEESEETTAGSTA